MKVLIVYATSEGQTRKIARYMEEVLQNEQHQVVIANANDDPPSPETFDVVFIGASVHVQAYQSAIKHYVKENVIALNHMPSAFFSVSMAVASDIEEEHEEAHNIAIEFLDKTGWFAHETKHIAGALMYTKYNYFKKLLMRMIAKQQDGATDTSQDHEYTDWNAVKTFALNFVNQIKLTKKN